MFSLILLARRRRAKHSRSLWKPARSDRKAVEACSTIRWCGPGPRLYLLVRAQPGVTARPRVRPRGRSRVSPWAREGADGPGRGAAPVLAPCPGRPGGRLRRPLRRRPALGRSPPTCRPTPSRCRRRADRPRRAYVWCGGVRGGAVRRGAVRDGCPWSARVPPAAPRGRAPWAADGRRRARPAASFGQIPRCAASLPPPRRPAAGLRAQADVPQRTEAHAQVRAGACVGARARPPFGRAAMTADRTRDGPSEDGPLGDGP